MVTLMTSTRGISELVLIVDDLISAAHFYRDVVGLVPEKDPGDGWAWFWAGPPGTAQRLALRKGSLLFEEHSPHPPERRWGLVHFALQVERAKLESAVERVHGAGVQVFGPVRLDWMRAKSFYFYDPMGNLVEFWSPDPG